MKICPNPKCQKPHDKPGTFCSRSCANSRVFSKESRLKKSLSNKKYWEKLEPQERDQIIRQIKAISHIRRGLRFESLMAADFNDLPYQSKRRRIIAEQEGKCSRCGNSEWLGEVLILEIDHRDGNKNNNSRENLEGLCPNCHSLTPTWRGKKNKKISDTYQRNLSDLKLLEELT